VADEDRALESGELGALRELVASEGWKRFTEQVEQEWGDRACIQKIRAAMRVLPVGDEDAERQTSVQILAAQREVQKLVAWPATRIAILKAPKPKRGALESLRRIARP